MEKRAFLTTVLLTLTLCAATSAQTIRYVDVGAPTGGDGTTWATAYKYLQDALLEPGTFDQVWVAKGTYKPDQSEHGHVTPGDREASFAMLNGVAIYGGFAGNEDSDTFDLDNRDLEANETLLNGDIGTLGDNADNCYHVFYHPEGTNLDVTAVLDGITVTHGNANIDYPRNNGGGMFNYSSSPTVTNCTFSVNSAIYGGGMSNIWSSSPTLTNCRFSENSASYSGGMRNSESSSPTLTNCTFSRNTGYDSGGMRNSENSSPTLTNCMFSGNSALYGMGGGMRNNGGTPTLTNCAFSGNSADVGGGMFNDDSSSPALTNCILWGNSAGAVGDEVYNSSFSTPTFIYCDIAGSGGSGAGWDTALGTDSGGNIDNNPLFVRDPDDGGDGWGDDPDTPDIDEGANDDAGDLRLLAGSPCIDAGDNEADTDASTPEIDPLPDTDLDGNPRFVDDPDTADTGHPGATGPPIVDMGAYENQGVPILLAAHSRRDHDGTSHDLPVPLDGILIEPRQNGTAPQMILSYDQPPADPGCGGIGVVGGNCISIAVLGNDLVIDMTFDANACVEITVGDDTLRLLTHTGNVNGDDEVNVVDLQDVKNHVFQDVDAMTCIYDINCDGTINVIDLQTTKNNVFVPAACD